MPDALSLASYQSRMSALLLQGAPEENIPALQGWLARTGCDVTRLEAGLAVYRNNVMYSLVTALRAQFPVTDRLVGDDFFGALARDFIRQHPPREPALTLYGEEMPAFINAHPACTRLPWLGDVARLEWLCQRSLHSQEAAPLQLDELLALPPEQLSECVLGLQPGVQLFTSPWPVQRIHEQHMKPEPGLLSLDCDASTHLLIHRQDHAVQIVTLQAPVYCLLKALQQRLSLQDAWQQVQSHFALPDFELTPMLVYLLRLQIFRQ